MNDENYLHSNSCPFCTFPEARVLGGNELSLYFLDGYPVSPGHTLVIPRRHVPTYFDASDEEKAALWRLVEEVKARLDRTHHPDGFNIGINVGEAAGQSVMHLHIHVIPRYSGDTANPRGGVRHSIPGKGYY